MRSPRRKTSSSLCRDHAGGAGPSNLSRISHDLGATGRTSQVQTGGVCLFRHRTAHKARRRTRATTSCRGGCRGLAELLFESLGARGGSQSPAPSRQTGRKRLASRRGGTRPTGVQYFSARGKFCARLSCTHAAASFAIVRGRGRARGGMAHFAAACAIWATESQPVRVSACAC
jgi:hypothetical protein